ncbi:MAG: hypothetical protein MI862_27155 [Desulfobacterales bacterium]|nr:hypothetical protein [Desulfobacterales bacterium]
MGANDLKSNWHTEFRKVEERIAKGNAPVLVEIICERVHCVMYDYAVNTVDMVAETFGDQIEIQTVVRRGGLKNATRFMKLCKRAGKLLSVPTILINGDVLFTTVPLPEELTAAIQEYLDKTTNPKNPGIHPTGKGRA